MVLMHYFVYHQKSLDAIEIRPDNYYYSLGKYTTFDHYICRRGAIVAELCSLRRSAIN